MLHAHSGFRWLALILIITTIVKAFQGIKNAEDYTAKNKMLALGTLIIFHLQFLIGFGLLFTSQKTALFNLELPYSFFTIIHPMMMTFAVILVTIGYSKAKKENYPSKKFRQILIYYTVALLIVLFAIPWPFINKLNGGWF